MNEKNVKYLKDTLKFMGFGLQLWDALEAHIREEQPEFSLIHQSVFNQDLLTATLYFRKGEPGDRYYFNRYEAILQYAQGPEREISQTFYLNRGQGITLKEAFNLLEGRAVHKNLFDQEGNQYQAWFQLNKKERDDSGNYLLKQFHQHYGYDLEKALEKLPILELEEPGQREALIRSLQKGNLQVVTMGELGKIERMFIQANPQYKSITLFNAGMKIVSNKLYIKQHSSGQQDAEKSIPAYPAEPAEPSLVFQETQPETETLTPELPSEAPGISKQKKSVGKNTREPAGKPDPDHLS